MGDEAMLCYLEDIRPWNIQTGMDASETHYASIKPLSDQRGPIRNGGKLSFFRRILVLFNTEFIGAVLKLTFSSGITDRTVQRMIDQ
jgi:hypothetical protein